MPLRFIKKYGEILINGALLAYWLWRVQLSAAFSNFDKKDWMSLASTSATVILAGVGAWGAYSWKTEFKRKKCFDAAITFADEAQKALTSIKSSTHQLQSGSPSGSSILQQAERRRDNLKQRLIRDEELINNISLNRFYYKSLLDTDAHNICQDIMTLTKGIVWHADEYVQYTKMLLELPTDEEVRGAYINGRSWLEETQQQRNEYTANIKECEKWMSLRQDSIVKIKIDEVQKRIDSILEINSL